MAIYAATVAYGECIHFDNLQDIVLRLYEHRTRKRPPWGGHWNM